MVSAKLNGTKVVGIYYGNTPAGAVDASSLTPWQLSNNQFLTYSGGVWDTSLVPVQPAPPTPAATATASINAILPDQVGNNGLVLKSDGTNTFWANVPAPSITVVKASDETRILSTMTNDVDFVSALTANTTYVLDGLLDFNNATSGTPDAQFQFTGPTGTVIKIGVHALSGNNSTTMIVIDALSTSSGQMDLVSGVSNPVFFKGIVKVGSTAGNFRLQWAQNTLGALNATTLKANSHWRLIPQ